MRTSDCSTAAESKAQLLWKESKEKPSDSLPQWFMEMVHLYSRTQLSGVPSLVIIFTTCLSLSSLDTSTVDACPGLPTVYASWN